MAREVQARQARSRRVFAMGVRMRYVGSTRCDGRLQVANDLLSLDSEQQRKAGLKTALRHIRGPRDS